MIKKKDIVAALLGAAVAVILWVTVLSRETELESVFLGFPFHSFADFWAELRMGRIDFSGNFLGNILLFIPLGFLLPWLAEKRPWLMTALAGFCVSLLVECMQLITARGYFELDDLLLNSMGAVTGCALHWLATRVKNILLKKKTKEKTA